MDKVVHFEIPADDTGRAKKFYEGVFDWKIASSGMPGPEYLLVQTVATDERQTPVEPGAINGGLMKREGGGAYPVLVVKVASIDESLVKIEAAGGKVVLPKMAVGDMGLYARITDSEGNIIGVWQDLPRS